jgi:hypothetical protein
VLIESQPKKANGHPISMAKEGLKDKPYIEPPPLPLKEKRKVPKAISTQEQINL